MSYFLFIRVLSICLSLVTMCFLLYSLHKRFSAVALLLLVGVCSSLAVVSYHLALAGARSSGVARGSYLLDVMFSIVGIIEPLGMVCFTTGVCLLALEKAGLSWWTRS